MLVPLPTPVAPPHAVAPAAAAVIIGSLDSNPRSAGSHGLLALHPAGLVLFADAFSRDDGRAVRRAVRAAGRPRPWLSVDQEGGVVQRIAGIGPPPATLLGALAPAASGRAYARAGLGLRSRGVAVDLAPVADVDRGGATAPRSFGGSPRRVAAHVAAAVRGLARAGVTSCVKHFPGLGAVARSSDDGVAIDERPAAAVVADLAAFRGAVAGGATCVMVSSVVAPALCPRPALLCARTYRLLRATGFRGAIVTDSVLARGLAPWGPPGRIAIAALRLGADGIVVTDASDAVSVAGAISRSVRSGGLRRGRLAAAVAAMRHLGRQRFRGAPGEEG